MDENLVIDCIGPHMLTVNVAGAEHSMSITPGVLRISRPGEAVHCNLEDFPLTYKVNEVKGRLSICDSTGRLVWCWRSVARTEIQATGYGRLARQSTAKQKSSPPSSAPSDRPLSQAAETLNTSDVARAAAELGKGLDNGTSSDEAADVSISTRVLNRRRAKKKRQASGLESSATISTIDARPTPSSASLRSKRAPKRNYQISSDSDTDVSRDNTPTQRPLRSSAQSSKRTPESSGCSDSDTRTSGITPAQTAFLLELIEILLRDHWEDAYDFAEPVDVEEQECPDYYNYIKEPMDLQTMKDNLSGGRYTSVRAFESHFDLMIANAIRFNGTTSDVAKHGQCLSHAFNCYMQAERKSK